MIIELVRKPLPLKVDRELAAEVRKRLEEENTTAVEKIQEIFDRIGADVDVEAIIEESFK